MRDRDLREELARWGRRLMAERLVTGAGGNISALAGDMVYLSPSGLAFDELGPEDYVGIELGSGEVVEGTRRPTSELLMHLACYRRRPDVGAVLHTHPRHTIALTSSGHDLRAMFADYHIYTRSRVPHLDYVTVTTPTLARAVEESVLAADVVVLRNHGVVTLGHGLKEAFYRMMSVEEAAEIQWLATLVGTPRFLTDAELGELDQLGSEQYRRALLAEAKSAARRPA